MIEPSPLQFGITQEQVDALDSQINILEAQLANPKVSGEDYTSTVGFFFAVVAWGIFILAGKTPTTSSKVVACIPAYFIGLIWIMLSTSYVQKLFFRVRSKKAASTLAELQNSPLYLKLSKYKEAQKQYNEWLEQVDKERKKAQEEWDRWQREWSKGQAPFWLSLDGISFEVELANLYKALGYEASLTSWTGDEGVDINLKKDGKNIIVQCKAHNKPVGAPTVRELFGSFHHFQADEAILACTAGFTASAINFAKGKPIRLIKLDDILKMQASLLRNMPAPPQPRSYQSDKRPYNSSQQPSANPTTYISAPTISRQQHIWSLAISSVVGIGIVSGYVLLTKIYSMPVLVPEKKIATLATPTPIPYAPIPTPQALPRSRRLLPQ